MGGVDRNYFSIDQQGQFSFSEDTPPNFERARRLRWGQRLRRHGRGPRRHRRSNTSPTLPVTVTVRDVNEPPDVSGQQSLSFTENQSTDLVLADLQRNRSRGASQRRHHPVVDLGHRRGRLHHRRERSAPVQERAQLRESRRLRPEQRLQLLGQGIGWKALRIPAGHGDGHRRQRTSHHHHGQQLSDVTSARMRTGPPASTPTGQRTPRRGR